MAMIQPLFTSESVSMGHPDKVADQISDAVLDAMIAVDAMCGVACETLCCTGLVVVAGSLYLIGDVLRRWERSDLPFVTTLRGREKAATLRPATVGRRASSSRGRGATARSVPSRREGGSPGPSESPTRPGLRGRRDRGTP